GASSPPPGRRSRTWRSAPAPVGSRRPSSRLLCRSTCRERKPAQGAAVCPARSGARVEPAPADAARPSGGAGPRAKGCRRGARATSTMTRGHKLALASCALGALLSAVLEVVHVRAHTRYAESFCSVGERFDCTSVALSSDSVLLGLPLPVWGIVGFAVIGALVWLRSSAALWPALFAALGSIPWLAV